MDDLGFLHRIEEDTSAVVAAPAHGVCGTRPFDTGLVDGFGRRIDYLRVSVTDRCDLRCTYCMAEHMSFLPKADMLTLEELDRLCGAFIRRGIRKIRLTGGEPLVRRGVMGLFHALGCHLRAGRLDELTLTTNGTQLARHAADLREAGVRRVNVSLDTLRPDRFTAITRWGRLPPVLDGIEAARAAGLSVKINTVVLKDVNDDELDDLVGWCGERGFDLTFIEVMPLGDIDGQGGRTTRAAQFRPLSEVRARLATTWTLTDSAHRSGGPARYVDVAETGRRIGFITPLTNNFCTNCNRIRVTCTGTLHPCLGQDEATDLRVPLRRSLSDGELDRAIRLAIGRKPKGHDFCSVADGTNVPLRRHMNVTGG